MKLYTERAYRVRQFLLICIQLLVVREVAVAQQSPKCAFDRTIQSVIALHPSFADSFKAVREGTRYINRAASKTSATAEVPVIPVVFHVILKQSQLSALRDSAGILLRVNSQVEAINRDFNALNADSTKIPDKFKGLFGHTDVKFALAHTTPDGKATPGYEIITTAKDGFDLEHGWGSGFGFSGAKYAAGGGANAWETDSYLNIWVINPLEDGKASNILGLCIPTYLATEETGIDPVERGVILHYAAFGIRSSPLDYYAKNSDFGRTLTHEIGHYFDLLHIWGDDEGKCPDNGGADDGIADTPPQAYPSSGCNTYPKYDACSRTGDGIMFMNYMDYSTDACQLMFTHGQVAKMSTTLQPGGDVFGLSQHPWLLSYPDPAHPLVLNEYAIYPNPADDILNIVFRRQPDGLKSIHITDVAGRYITGKEYDRQAAFYSFSVANLFAGIYFVTLEFDSGKEVRKVMVR